MTCDILENTDGFEKYSCEKDVLLTRRSRLHASVSQAHRHGYAVHEQGRDLVPHRVQTWTNPVRQTSILNFKIKRESLESHIMKESTAHAAQVLFLSLFNTVPRHASVTHVERYMLWTNNTRS